MEFEMDFGTATLSPGKQPAAKSGPLLASVDGQVARLSQDEVVFHDPRSGENHVMTMDVLAAMDASRQFQPLELHVATIMKRLPALQGKSHAVEKVFEFLRSRGLVVDAQDMLGKLRQGETQPAEEPAGLVIRTCDRPSELARLVDSLASSERGTGRGLRYLVVDDSRRSRSENASALRGLKELGLEVQHLDRQWRLRVCETLPKPALSQQILGLEDPDALTCGGAWNTALMLTAGERFLMLDDDFVLDPRLPAGGVNSDLSIREAPHVPMFFAGRGTEDLATALSRPGQDTSGGPYDPLAEHLASCGQAPGVLFGDGFGASVSPDTLRGLSYGQVASLLSGEVIKTTAAGAWGDWRMDTNLWLYLAPPEHTQGMRADEASYRALSHQPALAHGFDHLQLARMSNFTPLAFDNRQLMPCTVPTGRGEDFTFAAWLRYLYPDSLCLHFPTMLRHQRPAGSAESPVPEAYVPWLSRFAGEYALSQQEHCAAGPPEARLRSLVSILRDLADASAHDQQVMLGQFLAMLRSQIIEQAQTALTSLRPAPEFWVRDAKDWITENGRSLTNAAPPRLRDWPVNVSAGECAQGLSLGLTQYADQLEHWQSIWDHCRGNRESLLKV